MYALIGVPTYLRGDWHFTLNTYNSSLSFDFSTYVYMCAFKVKVWDITYAEYFNTVAAIMSTNLYGLQALQVCTYVRTYVHKYV